MGVMTASRVVIVDDDLLYRRIIKDWIKVDGSISSAAFNDPLLSVDLSTLTTPDVTKKRGNNPDHVYGVSQFYVRVARSKNQIVYHDPKIGNYAHSIVEGKKSRSMKRTLAKACQIIINP